MRLDVLQLYAWHALGHFAALTAVLAWDLAARLLEGVCRGGWSWRRARATTAGRPRAPRSRAPRRHTRPRTIRYARSNGRQCHVAEAHGSGQSARRPGRPSRGANREAATGTPSGAATARACCAATTRPGTGSPEPGPARRRAPARPSGGPASATATAHGKATCAAPG